MKTFQQVEDDEREALQRRLRKVQEIAHGFEKEIARLTAERDEWQDKVIEWINRSAKERADLAAVRQEITRLTAERDDIRVLVEAQVDALVALRAERDGFEKEKDYYKDLAEQFRKQGEPDRADLAAARVALETAVVILDGPPVGSIDSMNDLARLASYRADHTKYLLKKALSRLGTGEAR